MFESLELITICETVANQDDPYSTFITGDFDVITAFIFASFLLRLARNKNLIFATSQNFRREKRNIGHEYDVFCFPLLWLIVF